MIIYLLLYTRRSLIACRLHAEKSYSNYKEVPVSTNSSETQELAYSVNFTANKVTSTYLNTSVATYNIPQHELSFSI